MHYIADKHRAKALQRIRHEDENGEPYEAISFRLPRTQLASFRDLALKNVKNIKSIDVKDSMFENSSSKDEIRKNVKHLKSIEESVNLSPQEMDEINEYIIDFLKRHFQGKAWFKGGSYSYLMDVRKPRMMYSSDGGKIKVKNFADGILKYSDSGIGSELIDNWDYYDPEDIKDYFRPANAVRDQESHELANLKGD